MLEAYGSAAQKQPEDAQLLGQSEGYVEYNAQGRVIKGQAMPVSLSILKPKGVRLRGFTKQAAAL